MPKAPRRPEPGSSRTPLGYTANTASAGAVEDIASPGRTHKPESVSIYLDYNGVLNREGIDGLNLIMEKLDHIAGDVRITLISFRCQLRKCHQTLDELAEAKVLNMFDNIIFTAARTGDIQGELQQYSYDPMKSDHIRRAQRNDYHRCETEDYYWYTGSKDAYIAQGHNKFSTHVIFVDDKFPTVDSVKNMFPYATCIWMPMQRVSRPRIWMHEQNYSSAMNQKWIHIARNLEELYRIIGAATKLMRVNDMAIQLGSCAK